MGLPPDVARRGLPGSDVPSADLGIIPPMGIPLDSGLLPMIVHDLRTPLNVIGLTLRMLEESVPKGNPELDEDMRIIRENAAQMERMLKHLSDYYRLNDDSLDSVPSAFDPRRLASEMAEELAFRSPKGATPPVRVEILPDCPTEVELDQGRARMAIQNVLSNAINAAEGAPVQVAMRGGTGRWIIEVRVDRPPPFPVRSVALRPDKFARLIGVINERVGLELAVAARVTEIFGGSARLDVAEGRRSSVVLDWPVRMPAG